LADHAAVVRAMSETALDVLEGGRSDALDRVIADAKRIEEHEEVDRWQFADDVREAVDDLAEGQNGFGPESGVNTGLYRAIDEVNDRIRKAGIVSVGRQSIVGAYRTAQAWPSEARVSKATYWAHYELRGKEYDGIRQKALRRLAERQERVGPKDVRLWKSSQKPTVVTSFLTRVEKRIRAADHFLDENGLAPFIQIQQTNIPREEWDWRAITVDLQTFTRGHLTFSPEYLEELYEMQSTRL
jgi:hypothetical protein